MDVMLNRLAEMARRDEELNELLMSSEILSQPKEMGKLAKEKSGLQKVLVPYRQLLEVIEHLKQANEALNLDDKEIVEMAEMEIEELEEQKEKLVEKLEVLLIPVDPDDEKNAIVETVR